VRPIDRAQLEGTTTLVTWASSGIGEAISAELTGLDSDPTLDDADVSDRFTGASPARRGTGRSRGAGDPPPTAARSALPRLSVVASPRHPGPDASTVLGKTVLVLRAFTPQDRGVALAELGRRTGLAKGTLHRLCTDLVGTGILERHEDRYRLGRLMFELGMRASVERDLLEVATPYLQELRSVTNETVHLGVREGTEVVYVAKIAGHHQAKAPSRTGGRLGLHCTAVGKALLAHAPPEVVETIIARGLERRAPRTLTAPGLLVAQLEQVRATGVAYEFEESTVGLVCVGAPVFGPEGEVVAAVSVAGPITRFSPRAHAVRVRTTAQSISATLARRGTSSTPRIEFR
jgi:DNA-binding IclR family transcriptional regulator